MQNLPGGCRFKSVQAYFRIAIRFRHSWKSLIDHVADGARFEEQVQQALQIFTSKGPEHDSTGSSWEQRLAEERDRLLRAGDEGFRVMMKLARLDTGRARIAAAIFFGLSDDKRALEELRSLLHDPAAMVRSRASRFYAARIHPSGHRGNPWKNTERADAVPEGLTAIMLLVKDDNAKVQIDAISALTAYANLDDARVMKALRHSLESPRHKVRHAAARALRVSCPGCGEQPGPAESSPN